MIHNFPCSSEDYTDLSLGIRTATIRPELRPFDVGDTLAYHELVDGKYTGRCVEVLITHLYRGFNVANGYILIHFQLVFPSTDPKISTKTYAELLKNYCDLKSELEETRSELQKLRSQT